jgi:hypothetical protein
MSDNYLQHVITNVPNTTLKHSDGHPPRFTELTGMFEVLLLKLHRRHKNWGFIITATAYAYNYPTTSSQVSEIKVYDRTTGEVLGNLRRHDDQYCISNFRVSRERKRGDEVRTKDIVKAVRLIEKHFVPKSVTESLMGVANATERVIYDAHNTANIVLHRALGALMHDDTLAAFVLPHLEEIVAAVALRNKGAAERIQSLPECMVNATDTKGFRDARSTGKYYTVMIRSDNEYVVVDHSFDAHTIYTAETLPILLRGRVGMLKLTEVGAPIAGVGIRTGIGTFFIPKEV